MCKSTWKLGMAKLAAFILAVKSEGPLHSSVVVAKDQWRGVCT